MERKELLSSPEYWETNFQIEIWEVVRDYSRGKYIDEVRKELAISDKKLSEIIAGDWKGTVEEFVRIMLVCNKVPKIVIENLEDQK